MKNALRAALFLLVLTGSAWAFEPFVVRDIRVEGIQRIEAGTVFSYLPVKVGDTMTDEKAAGAIRTLFATGFCARFRVFIPAMASSRRCCRSKACEQAATISVRVRPVS